MSPAQTGPRRFAGRSVLVTGAAGGLGRADCLALASEGAHIWAADIDVAAAESLVPELTEAGGSGQAVHLDVADIDSWSALAAQAESAGPLHGLVNNAGVSLRAGIADTTVEQWRRVMDINLSSVFYGLKTLTPALARGAEDGGAAVVNVSSIAGMVGYFSATYGTSKWGVRGLSKVGALELAAHGVRVNSLHPGLTSTPLLHQAPDTTFVDESLRSVPAGRLAAPQEIARVVAFLLSDDAAYITGEEVVVDGGLTSGGLYHRILAGLAGRP
ncbi:MULTISPECIES: SDR family NAD(P)-dependent oxidoreductase [Streptomyces]|uniref:SDR family NAD(P)-dependent oxidoreductase n=1 Tax=Streptomyces TaxID=1883 RepID=UPI0004CAE369|nr:MULTISPECIES: SDR family NAD(P)-dependent oxidoreductase [Streptomyces]NUV35365.1 SDR family oxidoreductase [Streptomyces sp. KAI-27]NUV45236.1 SDR family oxidoreductase [Streptomyces sp. CAI-78]MBL0776888.1 SDR family oxidoreductase [Streptomyces albidoflavus]MBV1955899.1 SDR family oxidoreductase [Streptomyces sp. BV333]MCG5120716.1 SDR family oxidoreductase [Streptomyces sp. T7(2022)]